MNVTIIDDMIYVDLGKQTSHMSLWQDSDLCVGSSQETYARLDTGTDISIRE